MNSGRDPRRRLPAVHELLATARASSWIRRFGREPVRAALRDATAQLRGRVTASPELEADDGYRDRILDIASLLLERRTEPSLRAVVNATGVILHTNLGRAPLASEAWAAVQRVASTYSNLELRLDTGERGSRHDHCARLICELTGSEAAMIVNNNAAAVALAVNALAKDREVIVSHGELIEIGGSFRLPEVVERSGARLRAVGATNRTQLEDYRRAIGENTGMILKAHPSNYRIEGFVASVELRDLVALGRDSGVPVVHDLGSGLLAGAASLPGGEPAPAESVAAGADLVTWSGDKLLGGPQAGILHGRAQTVGCLRSNPLARAFRVDKMTVAALEATLALYRDPDRARRRIPVLRMIAEPVEEVERRAARALETVTPAVKARCSLCRLRAVVGGGSLPGVEIESAGLAVRGVDAELVESRCRSGTPPLIGRIRDDAFLLDFRTVLPGEEGAVMEVLASALETVS